MPVAGELELLRGRLERRPDPRLHGRAHAAEPPETELPEPRMGSSGALVPKRPAR
jgi:hypothetical protein